MPPSNNYFHVSFSLSRILSSQRLTSFDRTRSFPAIVSGFFAVIVFQFGKLSSFLLYYLRLTSYTSRLRNSLLEDLVSN